MNIAKHAIAITTVFVLSLPALAQGMEGHNPGVTQHNKPAAAMQFMSQGSETMTVQYIEPTTRPGIGTSANGKTVFSTSAVSREIVERGPSR